ncbi:hypothetical protein C8R47DRAFT_1214749 [Mycena vitilis]|nr:hypothetical protein C8R47DRAFT_1214749 [Mycena vitilis]
MAHRRLNAIWAKYTISPDPSSGVPSLHQACLALTKHSLQLTDIVGFGTGFKLHFDLGQRVSEVCSAMDLLLRPAARIHFGQSSFYIGDTLVYILTGFLGERLRAPQHQIVSSWIMLLNHLETAMHELKNLCIGDPRSRAHLERVSPYSHLVASLSPIVQSKLRPCDFELWGMAVPLSVRHKAATALIESQLPASETMHWKSRAVSPPKRSTPMDTSVARVVLTSSGSETAAVDSVFRSARLKVEKGDVAPLRKWIAARPPVEDAHIREETASVAPHAPIAAAPAAVKHPPRYPATSTPAVVADPHSVLGPLELATESQAPPTIRAVLRATGSAPPERSSGVREAGGHADVGIRLCGMHQLPTQGDRVISDHAPVAAVLAAVKDPPCDVELGGLTGNLIPSAKSIRASERFKPLTSRTHGLDLTEHPDAHFDVLADRFPQATPAVARTASRETSAVAHITHGATSYPDRQERDCLQTSGSTVLVALAGAPPKMDLRTQSCMSTHSTTVIKPSAPVDPEAWSPAPGLVVDGAAVELGGLEELGDQQSYCAVIAKTRTTEGTSQAKGTASPSLAHAIPKAPALYPPSIVARVAKTCALNAIGHREAYGTGKDTGAECAWLPPPSCALQHCTPVLVVKGLAADWLVAEAPAIGPSQQKPGAASQETHTLRLHEHTILPPACRQLSSDEFPAPVSSFEGGPVELGVLDERKDEIRSSPSVHTLSIHARVDVNSSLSSVRLTDIETAKTFSLVSTIAWTIAASYLACIDRGELAPCLAWAREGIGTVRAES